jgi:hypothetical protein
VRACFKRLTVSGFRAQVRPHAPDSVALLRDLTPVAVASVAQRWATQLGINPLALDRMFDGFVHDSFKVNSPAVLYHYTSWSGAEGILRSQQFWATAHDCTNDQAELRSADESIRQVARDLRKRSYGAAAATLDKLLEGYPTLQISKLRTVYMTCFSVARDDKEQWRKYADDGRGVCLGVRVLNEQPMEETDRATKIARVDYSEASWRDTLTAEFMKILPVMEIAEITRRNIELGLLALHRIAALPPSQPSNRRGQVSRNIAA